MFAAPPPSAQESSKPREAKNTSWFLVWQRRALRLTTPRETENGIQGGLTALKTHGDDLYEFTLSLSPEGHSFLDS